MYHAVVRNKLLATFKSLNEKDYEPILNSLAPSFEHFFSGTHALGGTRYTMKATRHWYERLRRVLPDLHFTVDHVTVSGWPWATTAFVEWRDKGQSLDGHAFNNQGVHVIRLRWGKVISVRIFCDTVVLADCLQRNGTHGAPEALEPPIDERVG